MRPAATPPFISRGFWYFLPAVRREHSKRGGRIVFLAALFAALLAGGAGAGAPQTKGGESSRADEIVSRLQRRYESTRTLRADFEQENHLKTLGRVTRSRGRLLLDKPGKIRAEYTAPEKQLVVSNGKRLWIYTPRLKQVIVGDMVGYTTGSVPMLFLAGKGNLSREFRIELVEEGTPARKGGAWKGGQPHRLSLRPLRPAAGIKDMWLDVDPENYRIVGLSYTDNFGNKTGIRFMNIVEGIPISAGLFEFEIPPGAEVLKMPSRSQR